MLTTREVDGLLKNLKKYRVFRPKRVRDMRVVFDDPEVDGVIIATPQHWHGLATIWACQAGKDVYVEKCVSFNIREGQKMIEAAMKYERIVQCGTQNRSSTYALNARDYIKNGNLGQVVAVNVNGLLNGPVPFNEKEGEEIPDTIDWNMWLGPAPIAPYSISRNKSWGYYWDYSEVMPSPMDQYIKWIWHELYWIILDFHSQSIVQEAVIFSTTSEISRITR